MIKLKQLLKEGREKSHCWLSPSGRIIPVRDTHDTTARKLIPSSKDPMIDLWKQGYQRVTYMYGGVLIAHNEFQPPNDIQKSVLKNIAIEGDHEKVEFDGGEEKPYIIWSVNDQLEEKTS